MKRWTRGVGCFLPMAWLLGVVGTGHAYEVNEKLSIGGVMAGAYQYRDVENDHPDFDNRGRGGGAFQPEVTFNPTGKDTIFFKVGFGAGNALKQTDPDKPSFALSPWAADLEDDVKDINGRNRDYLLNAWYKHTFRFSEDHTLGMTGGIIDATDYVDENAYANDEFTQFMNAALVNYPNGFAPSYDAGAAVEWELGLFSAKGVAMGVGENDNGNSYNYYAGQFGFHPKTGLGEGNHRVTLATTTSDFPDPGQEHCEAQRAVILSLDQELGDHFGAWARFGWGDDAPALVWKNLYSGGLHIKGKAWDRDKDHMGIGYAHLSKGNQDVDKSRVFETYYRFAFNEILAATADVQYMKDGFHEGDDRKGWVFGVRLAAEF